MFSLNTVLSLQLTKTADYFNIFQIDWIPSHAVHVDVATSHLPKRHRHIADAGQTF